MNTTPSLPAHDSAFAEIESLLHQQVRLHERMLGLLSEHRLALRAADLARLQACIDQHQPLAVQAQELEMRRLALVRSIVSGPASIPLKALLPLAPELRRARIGQIAEALRALLEKISSEQAAIKIAAETLADHMQGVIRQVYRQLSHAGTYARSGIVDSRVQVVSALDVRS